MANSKICIYIFLSFFYMDLIFLLDEYIVTYSHDVNKIKIKCMPLLIGMILRPGLNPQ